MSKQKTYKIKKDTVMEILKAKNLTQRELGEMVFESQQTIAKFKWTEETIKNVCKNLELLPCEILVPSTWDELKTESPHIHEWFTKYLKELEKEYIEENGINSNLISFIEALGYKIHYLNCIKIPFEKIKIGDLIGYIRLEKENRIKEYSIKEFTNLQNTIIDLIQK